jgi:hypothetical protein
VNPEKTKYMLMPHYQKAGQKHGIKIENRSFEDEAKFKYLGTTDQNCMQAEFGECSLSFRLNCFLLPYLGM